MQDGHYSRRHENHARHRPRRLDCHLDIRHRPSVVILDTAGIVDAVEGGDVHDVKKT